MRVSNSILPSDALPAIRISSSKSCNRVEQPAPMPEQPSIPNFVYTEQFGWTPVNPQALVQLQAQGGYLQHLAEDAARSVAQALYPFPTASPTYEHIDIEALERAQAMHAAQAQQAASSRELEAAVPKGRGRSKSAAKSKPGSKDPFVYVTPSEEVLQAIRERALFVPTYQVRLRVAQACECCRKRKAKCSGSRPACKRCIARKLECVYAPGGVGRIRKTKQVPPHMIGLKQAPHEDGQQVPMDVSPVEDSAPVPEPGAATCSSSTSSLDIPLAELSRNHPVKPLEPPAPQQASSDPQATATQQAPSYPQAMATRSLSAPSQESGFTAAYSAVSGNPRPQAHIVNNHAASQAQASYAYPNNPIHHSAAYATQQAQYAGLPPPRNPSLYYNYSQPPAMQQRSQSHPGHYAPSSHYMQDPAYVHMVARSYLAPGQAASQQQQPTFYAARPSVHSTELEQRHYALSSGTRGYSDALPPPPLTRAASDASTSSSVPSGAQTPADYFNRMPAAAYKTSGPGATAMLDMMQMARTHSVASTASAYSVPATPMDGVGVDPFSAGDDPMDKQIFDFSEFFEGFSVTE